ncbi:hypothetical protein M409DRAFT_68595 [Zasmidium cellare ATCC 36951]|uniref:Uncharacterized protein n=1 Tax=Zasmidium cellare ATCC 36951 TaxID=1080233 RepID=A0A6A6C8F9_ZASCE|nr:uncharacterized protein M409DRAFT_68595 [Zasmidium cellare ATCC 36951]KAF2163321.1 hypothetical protein M409DRAFT_68595 [Zasmidium cellare ATCC 36951]
MPRPTYTQEQIFQIYDRINLPSKWRLDLEEAKKGSSGDQALEYLTVLKRYTLANVPFENAELHYSRNQIIDIHPQILFQKIVTQGTGRGGYCMENNAFFGTVLRSLGFKIMSTGDHSMWYGFAHMINIVTIKDVRYMVDVGFGAGGATRPLPLEDGKIHLNIKPEHSVRLRYDTLEDFENPTSKVWILEKRMADDKPFLPNYCFPDNVEFLPADYMVMNQFTSTNKRVFFTQIVIAVKHILSEDGEEIVGDTVLMGNRLHRRVHGKKEDLGTLDSEGQRVEALEKHLGIRLSEMQRYGILGMQSMIGG